MSLSWHPRRTRSLSRLRSLSGVAECFAVLVHLRHAYFFRRRDIFCFGAPILDRRGHAVAAASISVPRFRLRPMAEQVYVAPLLEATTNVSRILGYRPNLSGAKAKAAVAGSIASRT